MTKAGRSSLIGLIAVSAALVTTPAYAAGPATVGDVNPLPAASWHGRPIKRPTADAAQLALAAADLRFAGPSLRIGDGYGDPGGSAAVRRVQRLLHRIGYRCGPVDGMFGPVTRASVQWFQIKHGLRATGRVGPRTLMLLRLRAAGTHLRKRAAPAARAAVVPASSAHAPEPFGPSAHASLPAVPIGAAALVALLAGAAVAWRRRRTPPAAEPPVPPSPDPLPPPQLASVIGYAAGRDRAECTRHARAIERACAERGWRVSAIVREGRAGQVDRNGHRGLALALEQLSHGAGGRLVASRLRDVGRNRRELATLLAWCSQSQVELVALDVGLDTGTTHGRLAARCLATVAYAESNRSGRGRARDIARGGATERTSQEVQS